MRWSQRNSKENCWTCFIVVMFVSLLLFTRLVLIIIYASFISEVPFQLVNISSIERWNALKQYADNIATLKLLIVITMFEMHNSKLFDMKLNKCSQLLHLRHPSCLHFIYNFYCKYRTAAFTNGILKQHIDGEEWIKTFCRFDKFFSLLCFNIFLCSRNLLRLRAL